MMLTGNGRIERLKHTVRIVTVKPDMQVMVGLKHVCLVHFRIQQILHEVVLNLMERGRRGVPCRFPEDEVLNRDQVPAIRLTVARR